jgi:hypothetical protein
MRLAKSVALTALLAAFGACSHEPGEDDGVCFFNLCDPPQRGDGGNSDGPRPVIDACSSGSSGGSCGDVDCSCSVESSVDVKIGKVSLACFCSTSECPDYDTARSRCEPFEVILQTYPACNLELINHRFDPFSPGASYVYDATTHALVGASRGSDIPSLACGDTLVFSRGGGTLLPPECMPGETKFPCRSDAGN